MLNGTAQRADDLDKTREPEVQAGRTVMMGRHVAQGLLGFLGWAGCFGPSKNGKHFCPLRNLMR